MHEVPPIYDLIWNHWPEWHDSPYILWVYSHLSSNGGQCNPKNQHLWMLVWITHQPPQISPPPPHSDPNYPLLFLSLHFSHSSSKWIPKQDKWNPSDSSALSNECRGRCRRTKCLEWEIRRRSCCYRILPSR